MQAHTFHIPVMGLGFTIDTPAKVAHYGIDSVISIVDDFLIESMRKLYSAKLDLPFSAITDKVEDHRAKRITEYLNLVDFAVKQKFEDLKLSIEGTTEEFQKYVELLPDFSEVKKNIIELLNNNTSIKEIKEWINQHLVLGSIDVNIMTKLDNAHYKNGKQLGPEHNDAHAALRGFANSNLDSSVVLSAGMNPRLYGYFTKFNDFFPDKNGNLKKRIILKVSDFRSALIQGKFLAKKGIWISEYRVESGLNCGGHAFATDGFLFGPILEEFKKNRESLFTTIYDMYTAALVSLNKNVPNKPHEMKITAQGGVGTAEEHSFLMENYNLDSIGWGSPFLLVSEATSIDEETQELLRKSEEDDFYTSNISPLGVKFNSVRGSSKDIEKEIKAAQGNPGSSCPKKFLTYNTEYTDIPICTASHKYQSLKLSELKLEITDAEKLKEETDKVINKSCLCVGLSTSALRANDISDKMHGNATSVCPGPNLAYFSELVSLKTMVDHIYGKINIMKRTDRPNLFMKELKLYIEHLADKVEDFSNPVTEKQVKYFDQFQENLQKGIKYYHELSEEVKGKFNQLMGSFSSELERLEVELNKLKSEFFHSEKISK